jgi:hypothetical protein
MQDERTKNVTLYKQSLLTWQDDRHFDTNATRNLGLSITTRRHPVILANYGLIRQHHDSNQFSHMEHHEDTQATLKTSRLKTELR